MPRLAMLRVPTTPYLAAKRRQKRRSCRQYRFTMSMRYADKMPNLMFCRLAPGVNNTTVGIVGVIACKYKGASAGERYSVRY